MDLQHSQQDKESLQEERASVRAQNEAMSEQMLQAQTKSVRLAHTESSNDDLVNQIGVLTNENTKLTHEVERLASVVQRKKDKKKQAVEEAKNARVQLLDEQGASAKVKIELEQTKMDSAGKDDQIKDLREQTDRLSAKIREEMQSVKYWMNDHKQLTEELDEEHDTHRKTMARMEERVADLDDQLKEAWAGRRDAAQALRDKERECKHLEKELAKHKQQNALLDGKLGQCDEKEEMSKKLLEVKIAHITEMENKLHENKMMMDAWSNHVTCMEIERDEALATLEACKAGGSGKSPAASSDLGQSVVRKI